MRIERGEDPGPFSRPRDYVTFLRALFRSRCAYCLTPDDRLGGEEAMEVDHFQPTSRRPNLRLAWSNLYYSCAICNNRKSSHPTEEEIAQQLRFVDPCSEDPDDHFRLTRYPDCGDYRRVNHLFDPGEYTIRRLQFNTRPFLRGFWRELHGAERNWEQHRQDVITLQARVGHADSEAKALLRQCEVELNKIRDRWPFPREEGTFAS